MCTKRTISQDLALFNIRRLTNKSIKGVKGIKEEPLWTFDPSDVVPPILHIPMGLLTHLWDAFENWQTRISNLKDNERQAIITMSSLQEDTKGYYDAKEKERHIIFNVPFSLYKIFIKLGTTVSHI